MNDKKLSLIEKLMANAGIKKEEKSLEIDISKANNSESDSLFEGAEFPKSVFYKREYTSEERKRLQKARSLLKEANEGLDFFKKELKGTGLSKNENFLKSLDNNKKIAQEIERIKLSLFAHKYINEDGSEYKTVKAKQLEAIEKSVEANA